MRQSDREESRIKKMEGFGGDETNAGRYIISLQNLNGSLVREIDLSLRLLPQKKNPPASSNLGPR